MLNGTGQCSSYCTQPVTPSKGEKMNCYKCYSKTDLSIKARFKDGQPRILVCKTCRREEYFSRKPGVDKQIPSSNQDVWREYANGVNKKLALKYKDVYIIK